MSLSDKIPLGGEYLAKWMEICMVNLESMIATPPSATATVAETRAYCKELEMQTRTVKAEIHLLNLVCNSTTSQVPKPQGLADRMDTLTMCNCLCDQVFGPKPSSSSLSLAETPIVHKTTVSSPLTSAGSPDAWNSEAILHVWATTLSGVPDLSDTCTLLSQKVYPLYLPLLHGQNTAMMAQTHALGE